MHIVNKFYLIFFLIYNNITYVTFCFAGAYLYFNFVTLLSIYCNFCGAHLLSMHTESALHCKLIFGGVVLPLQLLLSGFLVLIETMPAW